LINLYKYLLRNVFRLGWRPQQRQCHAVHPILVALYQQPKGGLAALLQLRYQFGLVGAQGRAAGLRNGDRQKQTRRHNSEWCKGQVCAGNKTPTGATRD
jgi:hypothetical protein